MGTTLVDWQAENEKINADGTRGSLLSFIICSGLANMKMSQEESNRIFDKISRSSNHFRELQVTMTINGVEVPLNELFKSMEEQLDEVVLRAANELLTKRTVFGRLSEIGHELTKQAKRQLSEIGIEVGTILENEDDSD